MNVQFGANPLSDVVRPVTGLLPNWFKLDGAAAAAYVWWYLGSIGATQNEQLMAAGGVAVLHGLLHGPTCNQQESMWTSPTE